MAVDLLTNVIIGGQTTSGFNALAGRLQSLGATVDKIGSYVREFEKESVQVYRNYEDNMLAAEYALSAQYDSATELSKVMMNLDQYASAWAAGSIFHTDDVSRAINEAAHAGWDYTKIVKGIPQAMLIAQAGSMELSTGLDYLVKMMGSTGTEFDDMGTVIDEWSKAANLSATSIDEMGQAFMSMGAAAQFGDSTAELFTLLAVLADVGTTGSQAGTALRSAMMRIVAPTTKAENAMSLLGAEADEINEVLADTNVTKAAKQLEGLGFSAYDSQGNLLPMIDIFTNLHTALQGLDEQAQNEILAAIFPTRTIASAKAFMDAVGNGKMAGLFENISDSEGYAAKGADIMMSGLTGAIETLASKWEEFKRSVGETLAPAIEKVAGWLGTIMDAVNSMDQSTLTGLVTALTGIAGAGPGLFIAGGAIKFFGTLGPVGSAMLLVGAGAAFLASKLAALNEAEFKGNFGTMELDLDTLGEHVDSLKTKFDAQQEAISTWETALEAAEESYAAKSSALAETMLTDVLTGKQLTETEKKNLRDYAQSMYDAVWEGLENAEASDMTFLDAIFGDHESAEQEIAGNTARQVVTSWYESLYGDARKIGEELRNQMTEALQDGELNEAERQAIQSSVDRYNQIMTEIQSQMDAEDYQTQLYKAQSVSWDTADAYITENAQKMDADLAAVEELYARKYGHYAAAYESAIKSGLEIETLSGEVRPVTEDDLGALREQIDLEKETAIQGVYDKYGTLDSEMFNALMLAPGSNYADAWSLLRQAKFKNDGSLDAESLFLGMNREELLKANEDLTEFAMGQGDIYKRLPQSFFKTEQGKAITELAKFADQAAKEAGRYYTMLDQYGVDTVQANPKRWGEAIEASSRQQQLDYLQGELDRVNADIEATERRMEEKGGGKDWWYSLQSGEVGDYVHMHGGEWDTNGGLYGQRDALQGQIEALQVEIAGGAEAGTQALAEAQGVLGDGVTVDIQADGGYEAINAQLSVMQSEANRGVTVPVRTIGGPGTVKTELYAEGGRATVASIFGEAGPEWAIPEEHSERTAALLDAAREASGFTWGELLSRFGGLNANPRNQNVVVNYSPTINAQNADGVASMLAADKARLLKMVRDALSEQRTRDEVEVYA